ncbi:unnamed protein product [Durusdinium trenchii]|uniref:Threonine-phosphate decarboxylase n=2 Tax=Durusdinium trenchii TaxID=1381693 RepID=A0ABP0PWH0_9DINO
MAPHGRVQDFNFDLETIAPFVESFANKTGIPVGGICQDVSCVDLIWKDSPNTQEEPYTLEALLAWDWKRSADLHCLDAGARRQVSPTSDINPPSPPDWKEGYAEFKHTKARAQSIGRIWSLCSKDERIATIRNSKKLIR